MIENLNEQQRKAVNTTGHVLLTACPGSGKTRVLTYRVALELQRLSPKKMVAALTFTNRAADEIKRRVDRLDLDSGRLWAGTIHAFCLEWLLYPYCSYLPELNNGFTVADEYLMAEMITETKLSFGYNSFDRISTKLDSDGNFQEQNVALHPVIEAYWERLKEHKLIDFDQMLYLSYKLLKKYPKIAGTLNGLFQLICVDEYQDTQELQYRILSVIINANSLRCTIFFVGDRDQAIYGSLGGVAKSLAEIRKQFNGIIIKELELSGNYRSTQRVIDFYRNFQNENISIQSRCPYRSDKGIISLNSLLHKDALVERVAQIIKTNIDNGVSEGEICVLAPQWWMVIPMGRQLKLLLPEVSFDAVGLSPMSGNKENIWFKFARLFLVDPAPNMYFVRKRWAKELVNDLDVFGLLIFQNSENRPGELLKAMNSVSSKCGLGIDYLEDCFNQLLDLLSIIKTNHQMLELHWNSFFDSTRAKLADTKAKYATDLLSFKRLFRHNKGVVVNTCHGIKGEEFHTVICFGLLNGFIPSRWEDDTQSAGNKLLYVICSRAKMNLHLFSERGHRNNQQMTPQLSSTVYKYDE